MTRALLWLTLISASGCFKVRYGEGASAPRIILFDSTWDTARGTSDLAVRDGERWSSAVSEGRPLEVLPGGPAGHNRLAVPRNAGSTSLLLSDFEPLAESFFLRFYLSNDDVPETAHYSVGSEAIASGRGIIFVQRVPHSGGTGLTLRVGEAFRDSEPQMYVTGRWTLDGALQSGTFYRLEFHVEYLDATHVRVHPRIFDEAGAVLWDDDDFRQADFGMTSWGDRATWTLATFYEAGHHFEIDPEHLRALWLGDQGMLSPDAGTSWHFAGFQVRQDTWPGPLD